jgi:hypothetical protein
MSKETAGSHDSTSSTEPSSSGPAESTEPDGSTESAESTGSAPPAALPPKKRRAFGLIVVLIVLTICFGVGEIAARIAGLKPWDPQAGRLNQDIRPGGTLFAPHPKLGYALLPGQFTIKQSQFSWTVTQPSALHRVTRPDGAAPEGRDAIWIFGDSFTYGMGVDDDATYSWLIQQKHPEIEVVNFGVGGYSTLQSLIELEETLAAGVKPPRVAVIAYSSFHDGRNALLRGNRKSWIPYVERYPEFPAAQVEEGKLKYGMVKLEYTPWPLEERSALVNFIEEKSNKAQVITSGAQRVSQAIVLRFADLCKQHGIAFVFAGIYRDARTSSMVQWAEAQGIRALDISVDYTRPENVLPGDGHPSPKANVAFANSLEPILPKRP